jgi:hypothetical protein
MTSTGTTATTNTVETLSNPPPVRPPRRFLTAVALTAFAAAALTPWLIGTNSQNEANPMTTRVAASPQQAGPALGQARSGRHAYGLDAPTAYVLFCQNSPVLCAPPVPTLANTGYLQFCWNSPSLCAVP